MVIIKVKVSMGEEEVMVIIVKKFIIGIRTLEPNVMRTASSHGVMPYGGRTTGYAVVLVPVTLITE